MRARRWDWDSNPPISSLPKQDSNLQCPRGPRINSALDGRRPVRECAASRRGGPRGDRTPDRLGVSEMLYQLSYRSMKSSRSLRRAFGWGRTSAPRVGAGCSSAELRRPVLCCSPGRTRTCDTPVNSRMLCQLSYRGMRRWTTAARNDITASAIRVPFECLPRDSNPDALTGTGS